LDAAAVLKPARREKTAGPLQFNFERQVKPWRPLGPLPFQTATPR